MIKQYNKPVLFYTLSLVLPWIFWFTAAYISNLPNNNSILVFLQAALGIAGLVSPIIVALFIILKNHTLVSDIKKRLLITRGFSPWYVALALLLIFASIVLAQLISLLFGYSINQFKITGQPGFTSALFSPWFVLCFAPVAEELAWHSYGTDTLRQRFNLFITSVIFAIYWVLWHLPLSFIKGYYHSNVVAGGAIYTLNFVFSLFVFVLLMNWLYYKTNRNLLITIMFHLSANLSNEIFATHPMSKVIQTGILLLVCIVVIASNRKMFFSKAYY